MTHQDIDRRSLMMHRIIAARLRAQPELIAVVNANMARWNCPERHWWREWSAILSTQTVQEIANLIEQEGEDACRMRQSAPFAGILTPKEVWELKRQFKIELESAAPAEGRHSVDPCRADRMSALLTLAADS